MHTPQKVIFITGTSSGMGRAMVLFLAQEGFRIYATSRTPEKIPQHKNVTALKLDLTNPQNITEVLSSIEQIDILVNNAGYGLVSTVEEVSEEEMLAQFNINVFGLLRVCKAVIPKMRKQNSGVIINISSFLGKIGLPLFTFYNASKYAVEGVTDSLRYELKDFNIRVHSIMPGFFDTHFAKENLVVNENLFSTKSPYEQMVKGLIPTIVEQINEGNQSDEVARMVLDIINNEASPARQTAGEKAEKFLAMKQELSDEDFERRVREYYFL